jgi:uncharacterized membrane protein (DUF4010 family)
VPSRSALPLMPPSDTLADAPIIPLAVALAIGVLIGIERERSKGQGPDRQAGGLRTFTLISLAGAMSLLLGDLVAFVAFGVVIGVVVAVAYARSAKGDPGMTTEVAMIVAYLLGGLALHRPQLAAALAVIVTIVLVARSRVHDWAHNVLTDQEVRDGLTLAAAALVILPLIPEQPVDPWGVVQPRKLWMLAVLMMAINGLGYIALRALGPRIGLSIAGFFAGFVSSTATIGAMGSRSRKHPELRHGAVAGAAASSVATVIQLAIVIALVSMVTLRTLVPSLLAAGAAAVLYAGFFALRSARETPDREPPAGRPFNPKTALLFVLVVGTALTIAALLTRWLGDRGLLIASGVAGFGDAHAAAISAASLAATERTQPALAALAILIGFTTNSVSKLVVAFSLGDRRFAFELLPGLALMLIAAWGAWLARALLA